MTADKVIAVAEALKGVRRDLDALGESEWQDMVPHIDLTAYAAILWAVELQLRSQLPLNEDQIDVLLHITDALYHLRDVSPELAAWPPGREAREK